jgi:hypothetical protein
MANDTRLPAGDQDGDWMGAIEQTQRDGVAETNKPKAQQVWPTWGTASDARTVSLAQPLPVQLPTISRGAGAADAQTLRIVQASDSPGVASLAAIDADLGALTTVAAPADGLGDYSVIGALKRALLNWATLLTRTTPGQAVAASSLPVVIASNQTAVPVSGSVTATGAATETTLAALNTKVPAQAVPGFLPVDTLGVLGVARQLAAGALSANTVLTTTTRRVSVHARTADIRFAVGAGAQTASATSHYIAAGERLDFDIPASAQIAVIRAGATDGTLELSELA